LQALEQYIAVLRLPVPVPTVNGLLQRWHLNRVVALPGRLPPHPLRAGSLFSQTGSKHAGKSTHRTPELVWTNAGGNLYAQDGSNLTSVEGNGTSGQLSVRPHHADGLQYRTSVGRWMQ